MSTEHPDGQPASREVECRSAATVEGTTAMEDGNGAEIGAEPSGADGSTGNEEEKTGNLTLMIEQLKGGKNKLKEQKKHVMKTLHNAKRRHSRLKKKTKQLSENDLLEALRLKRSRDAA